MGYASRLMRGIPTQRRFAAAALAIALLTTACNNSGTTATTTAGAPATTAASQSTAPPVTTSPATTAPVITTEEPVDDAQELPTVTASPGIEQDVVDRLTDQIIELVAATEEVRGLSFLTQPIVAIVTPDELGERVREQLEEELDSDELAVETNLLQLLGLLEPEDDLEPMLVDLYSEQVAGFYDGDTGEMVIAGEASDLTPLTKSVVVHEFVHALTDQHFLFNADFEAMFEEERYDQGSAFQALIEGDATYFQLVYIQQLPLAEQMAVATEALDQLGQTPVINSVPAWIQDDLAFPYNTGQGFVESLVTAGGIAAVDAAYVDRPVSTEVVMHPPRYSSGELILQVEPVDLTLDGYEVHETSTYGEWGFWILLSPTTEPGVVAQAANGWGGDSYQVLSKGEDVVIAIAYKGDTEDDAFELTDALISHVTDTMGMGEGVANAGGLEWTSEEDGRYAFINRAGDGFVFVVSTDAAAGAAARDQVRIP